MNLISLFFLLWLLFTYIDNARYAWNLNFRCRYGQQNASTCALEFDVFSMLLCWKRYTGIHIYYIYEIIYIRIYIYIYIYIYVYIYIYTYTYIYIKKIIILFVIVLVDTKKNFFRLTVTSLHYGITVICYME